MINLSHMGSNTAKGAASLFKFTNYIFPSSHYALLSLLYVVGLELIFALQQWKIPVSITVLAVIVIGIILVRSEEQHRFSLDNTILPFLAAIGITGFTFLLPTTPILHLYITASGLILFFLLKHGARQAYPVWNWTISLVVYFLNISFIIGFRFHVYLPILLVLVAVLLISGLMSWQALRRVSSRADAILPVLAITFVLAEFTWALQFLPAHYLVQASLITTLYYILFNLTSISFEKKIARKDLLEYVFVGLVATLIVIISARWT